MENKKGISGSTLKMIAIVTMVIDHIGAAVLARLLMVNGLGELDQTNADAIMQWLSANGALYWTYTIMRMIGRVAFPIFCFLLVEGFLHTHDVKKYAMRLGLFALLSEIPFDLMYGGTWFYPVHQNVIWTFILGLLGIHIMETVRKKKKTPVFVLTAILVTIAGGLLGTLTMVDYYGIGVLTVFIFYFFRGRKWWCLLGQIAALYWVNVELLGGLMYPVRLFGMEFELCQQGLALLALVPIWLYRGRQGYHSKPFQYFCYAFYPVHMLILVLILGFVNR